ncbi:hypothetical protein FNH09_43975, partial [Streptomyces adustus]|nr:hypothetical protein [Streptomyces adustus]
GGAGPRRPGGPPDRYRNDDGQIVDRRTGQVLHDQHTDRTLLSTRAHNRLVRLRGYRILHRGGRAAYGATAGLPAGVRRARTGGSRYSQDARQQVQVWGNTVREDAQAWGDTGRHVARVLRENTDDRGGPGPFASRRLPARPAPTPRPTGSPTPTGRTAPASPASDTPASPARNRTPQPQQRADPAPSRTRPASPAGTGASSTARDEARARMRDLMRQHGVEGEPQRQADRLREMRQRWQTEDGEDG